MIQAMDTGASPLPSCANDPGELLSVLVSWFPQDGDNSTRFAELLWGGPAFIKHKAAIVRSCTITQKMIMEALPAWKFCVLDSLGPTTGRRGESKRKSQGSRDFEENLVKIPLTPAVLLEDFLGLVERYNCALASQ